MTHFRTLRSHLYELGEPGDDRLWIQDVVIAAFHERGELPGKQKNATAGYLTQDIEIGTVSKERVFKTRE